MDSKKSALDVLRPLVTTFATECSTEDLLWFVQLIRDLESGRKLDATPTPVEKRKGKSRGRTGRDGPLKYLTDDMGPGTLAELVKRTTDPIFMSKYPKFRLPKDPDKAGKAILKMFGKSPNSYGLLGDGETWARKKSGAPKNGKPSPDMPQ